MWPIQKLYNERHKKKKNGKENLLEKELHELLKKSYPKEWSFVGDGSYLIGEKKPDFINKKKKLIIEVFGDFWHCGENPSERIEYFKRFGYNTMIIWEHEFKNENKIKSRLKEFIGT
jgi:G:T-mismatch repair DNA endonuclease (very short patch repair protein)